MVEDIEKKKQRADLYIDLLNFSFFDFEHPYEAGLQERGMLKTFKLLGLSHLVNEYNDLFEKLINYDFSLANENKSLNKSLLAYFVYDVMGVMN